MDEKLDLDELLDELLLRPQPLFTLNALWGFMIFFNGFSGFKADKAAAPTARPTFGATD